MCVHMLSHVPQGWTRMPMLWLADDPMLWPLIWLQLLAHDMGSRAGIARAGS